MLDPVEEEVRPAGRGPGEDATWQWGWVIPVGFAALVYYPVLKNFFWADDFYAFWYLTNHGWLRFLLLPHAGHSCVTRNAIIILWSALFGTHPSPYLGLLLLTHLLNVFLLFRVISRLTGSGRLGAILATLWGIAPAQEETVGWFAAYGQALAVTCGLCVLDALTRLRAGVGPLKWAPWWWGVAMITAVLSFGIGIGLAVAMPVLAMVLLPRGRYRLWVCLRLTVCAFIGIAVYTLQHRIFVEWYHQTVWLVPPQAVLRDWLPKLSFFVSLARQGVVTYLAGVWTLPPDSHVAMAIVAVTVLLIGIAGAQSPKQVGVVLLVSVVWAFAVYGPIAVGRQPFINGVNESWLIQTPRYQYGGMIAAALAAAAVIVGFQGRWAIGDRLKNAAVGTCVTTVVGLRLTVGPSINHYDRALRETVSVLESIEQAAAATPSGEDVFMMNQPFRAASAPFQDFPGRAALFAIFSPDGTFDGHRVRFVVRDPRDLVAAQAGRRAPNLLCAPKDVPSGASAH